MQETLLAVLLLPTVLSQYIMDGGPKADLTFNDENDRFDLTELNQYSNQYFQNLEGATQFEGRRMGGTKSKPFRQPAVPVVIWASLLKPRRKLTNHYDPNKNDAALLSLIKQNVKDYGYKNHNLPILLQLLRLGARRYEPSDDWIDQNLAWRDDVVEDSLEESDFRTELGSYLHGGKSRRMLEPEKEILLHHAVPIKMKVEGFLQAPVL